MHPFLTEIAAEQVDANTLVLRYRGESVEVPFGIDEDVFFANWSKLNKFLEDHDVSLSKLELRELQDYIKACYSAA